MKKTYKRINIFDVTFNLKFAFVISFSFFTFHFSFSQDLEILIEEGLANSPEIQQFEMQYKVVVEKVNEVNEIPNTEIGFGYFVNEVETKLGPQKAKLFVKQMLPWFGSVTARENYITSLSDASYEDIVISKRKLVTAISQSYYNLNTFKSKENIFIENIELLDKYKELALNSVEVAKASAVDVLRLQMRQNELEQLLLIIRQEYLAEQTLINKLLNRDKSISIQLENELSIPLVESQIAVDKLKLHPELMKYDKIYESIGNSELLNQKEGAPLIGFGFDYVAVQKIPNVDFSDNGKDVFMPMVSVSIPIFNKKYASKTVQNKLKQEEITFQKQDRQNKLETVLDKAIKDRISARISFDTQVKNLIQATNAEDILIKSYETGNIDFNDVLDIQELQLKFQINQVEAVRSYFIQTALINYLCN